MPRGWFDDLFTRPPQAPATPTRRGWFDDLFGSPAEEDPWERQGIFEVNRQTGERRLGNNVPGGLPTAQIDEVIPDLPQPDREFDTGAAGRLAGATAIEGVPGILGAVDAASDWLNKPRQETAGFGDGLLENVRQGLGYSPIGLGLRVGKAVRDKLGVSDAIATSNEAIEALKEQEKEKIRRSADTPLGSVAAEYLTQGAGVLADPTNLLGLSALQRGGRAIAEATTKGSLRRFLLYGADDAGEAAAGAAARATPEAAAAEASLPRASMKVERNSNLSPEHAQVQEEFARWIEEDQDRAVDAYAALRDSEGGTVINTDIARELSPTYSASNENRATLSNAVHEPASHLAKAAWRRLLESPAPKGKNAEILFTAGGTGAGKTTGRGLVTSPYQGVYDGNLNNVESATIKIRQALEAGKDVTILYTHRDPVEAFRYGAIPRAMGKGRMVPIVAHADTHVGAPETFTKLREIYKDDPRVNFLAVDNSLGRGKARRVAPEFVDQVRYSREDLIERLRAAAEEAFAAGEASEAVYRGSLDGIEGSAQAAQRGVRGVSGASAEQSARGLRSAVLNDTAGRKAGEPAAAADLVPDTAPEIVGRESVAYLSSGKPVPYRWVLRDADSLEASHLDDFSLNPNYPHGTGAQPRDLTDAAEQLKIARIRDGYNPDRVGPSSGVADEGAGFFARTPAGRPYMLVGNSRTIAQRQALSSPDKMAAQVEALSRQNSEFGFPPDFLELARAAGIRKPVAVRELIGDVDPLEMGRLGNTRAAAALSERDVASADAKAISTDLLGSFVDGASIDSLANRDFVRGFLAEVIPHVEHGPFFGPTGELTSSGTRRIRNALFAAAYDDPDAIARLVDHEAEGIKNVGRGMADQAARLARIERGAADGSGYPLAIGKDVAAAARKLAELRDKRMPVEMYIRNGELFARELTDESRRLLEVFEQTKRDRGAVGGILRRYAEIVESYKSPRQISILPPPPPKLAILEEAIQTWKQSEGPLLFEGGASALVAGIADALPGPLGAVVKRLDPSKALAAARRWLTNWGDFAPFGNRIGPAAAEAERLARAGRTAEEARAAQNLVDFDVALKAFHRELSEAGITRTEDEILQTVLDGITGRGDLSGLSSELQRVAGEMRDHLDELTGGILDNQELTKELRLTLDKNLGQYLRRTYQIHRDPVAWETVVKEQEPWRWENAKSWVADQNPEWTNDEIERYLNGFFQRESEAATALAPQSDVFRVERGLFKHRIRQHVVHIDGEPSRTYATKEAAQKAADELRGIGKEVTVAEEEGLPKALEEFLGLHMDPRARYAESVARMAHDISTAKLFGEFRQLGEGTIFFAEGMGPGSHAAKIAGDPAFNPLAGMYTTPEVRAVIESMGRATDAPAWLVMLHRANALVRAGKTVAAPKTHIRNSLSWIPMLIANGHWTSVVNIPRLFKAGKVVGGARLAMQGRTARVLEAMGDAIETVAGERLSKVFKFDIPSLRGEHRLAIRLGVVGEGARSQEMARYIGLVEKSDLAQRIGGAAGGRVGQAAGKVAAVGRELYMAEDDIGKFVGWLSERANLRWAFPEWTEEQVAEEAARMVRDLLPTYSKAPPAVRAIRDFPFVGDFPTFWAEMIRTSKNVLKRGCWELAQAGDNPRLAMIGAKRLAGFATAVTAASAVGSAMLGRLGISGEEMEAAKEFAPEWNRNSDLIPAAKKGPGQYTVVDVSYVMPHAQFREVFNALTANGYAWDQRIENAFEELRAPFSNESIIGATLNDLSRNRTEYGRQIYPPLGTRFEKARAIAKHLADRMQPGFVSEGQEAYAGATGELNPRTGRLVDMERLAYSYLTGTRTFEVDVPKRLIGEAHTLQRHRSDIVSRYNRLKRNAFGPTQELLQERASANAQWRRALEGMRLKVNAARKTGLSDFQIRKLLKDAQIGNETIDAVMGSQDFEVVR